MEKNLLEKYFSNKCTNQELETVLSWFRNHDDNKDLLYKRWEDLPEEIKLHSDFDTILHKIHHKINLTEAECLNDRAQNNLPEYNRRQKIFRFVRLAAAILLLPVLTLGIVYSIKYYTIRTQQFTIAQAYNEVFSSVDAITVVSLPDGSKVWLNHSSSLRYPAAFAKTFREVELKGEGYFEVFHNPDLPFIVNASGIQVVAHGTSFNVMAYPAEDKLEASLISGSVELRRVLPDGNTSTLYKMKPKDYTLYNKQNGQIQTMSITDDRYFSWKEGKLIFTAETLTEVTRKLSRWFNVEFQIKDDGLSNLKLTATFINESLPQVMGLLGRIYPISYSISDRKKNEDGTFTREKVIIYRK